MHHTVSYACLLGITWKALGEGTRCHCLNKETVALPFPVFKERSSCLACLGSTECVECLTEARR